MHNKKLILLFAALIAATLWGCGSSRDSGGDQTSPGSTLASVQNVGSDSCKVCHTLVHTTDVSPLVGSVSPNALAIVHECEACHGGGQYHYGTGPLPYPTPDITRCATCHSTNVEKVLASKHNGEEPENTEMLLGGHDTGKCQRCHSVEGSIEFADVIGTSRPALPNLDADGNHLLHNVTCAACHEPLTAKLRTVAGWDPNGNAAADQFDLCTSCHVFQNGGTLYASGSTYKVSTAAGADGGWFTADDTLSAGTVTEKFYHDTAWYRTIASTHFDNPDSAGVIEGYVVRKNGASPCFDCHGHELHTNTRYAGATVVNDTDTKGTIHTDWAQSAHAGGLLKAKYAVARNADGTNKSGTVALTDAVMGVGAIDAEIGNAWVHYDWDSISRQGCQQCHTATGNSNFMKAQAAGAVYNGKKNDFSHLGGWVGTTNADGEFTSATVSSQNELLYCWGCHSSVETGALHAPADKGITLGYKVDNVSVALPNLGSSNACVGCHSGRGNVQSLLGASTVIDPAAVLTATTTPKSTATATSTHYLTPAATIFKDETGIGYEFPGLDYADPAFYKHNTIGCVDCHMKSEKSHSFEVAEKDGTGAITAINSQATCNSCHTTYPMNAAILEEEALGYEEALHAFEHELALKGYVFANAYPYFYADGADADLDADLFFKSPTGVTPAVYSAVATDRNGDGMVDTLDWSDFNADGLIDAADQAYNKPAIWATQGDLGAAHNFNYLHHEPGAYAHNRFYAKRLIFDSIDWLDNGAMNGTITVDTLAYPEAALWLGAGANGVATRP